MFYNTPVNFLPLKSWRNNLNGTLSKWWHKVNISDMDRQYANSSEASNTNKLKKSIFQSPTTCFRFGEKPCETKQGCLEAIMTPCHHFNVSCFTTLQSIFLCQYDYVTEDKFAQTTLLVLIVILSCFFLIEKVVLFHHCSTVNA